MKYALSLNYSSMGLLGTINFFGYTLAVLICGHLANIFGYRRLIATALLLIGFSMVLISKAHCFQTVMILYFLTGIGSGAANVPMMTLTAGWFASSTKGTGTGFIVTGNGFAILLSGILIPAVNRAAGSEGWRYNWLILGLITSIIAGVCYLVLRDHPATLGLKPYGKKRPETIRQSHKRELSLSRLHFLHLAFIYFLFGFTYVIYTTFIVTSLIQDKGFSEAGAGMFWSWVGLLSIASGPLFGSLSDRIGRAPALISVFSIQACAYLLAALPLKGLMAFMSIVFFGLAAWSIPTIMAALISDIVGSEKAATVFGRLTVAFAVGQISGPAVAGWVAQGAGSFAPSFGLAAAFAVGAALLSIPLREQQH